MTPVQAPVALAPWPTEELPEFAARLRRAARAALEEAMGYPLSPDA